MFLNILHNVYTLQKQIKQQRLNNQLTPASDAKERVKIVVSALLLFDTWAAFLRIDNAILLKTFFFNPKGY